MANIAISLLFQILFGKGGADMMAMLWAQQIMLGKKTFAQVPAKLRDQVGGLLVDSGVGELAE